MDLKPIKSRLVNFFSTSIWELEPEAFAGMRRQGVRFMQIFILVIRNFQRDQCMLHASALTFTTLLSLVPFLAMAFAVLKGLGVHNKVEPMILNRVAAGSQETVDRIITYIDKTNMTSLGAIGLAALILSVVSLLGNIEKSFNIIWSVRETRSFYRKFSDYLSVVVIGPLLLLAGISITSSMQSQTFVKWLLEKTYLGDFLLFLFNLAPYVTIWLAMIFLYIFIPNTRVRFKSAMIGGIISGTIWQLAQWGYIHFQVGVAKYNAVYGTLAALPVFMVWIYASWMIVLFGVEVVCAHQNIRAFLREARNTCFSQKNRELISLAILEKICAAFHFGRKPKTARQLEEELNIPAGIIGEILTSLLGAGYILENAGEAAAYMPARELEDIAAGDVIESLRSYGNGQDLAARNDSVIRMARIIERMDDGAQNALKGMNMKELVTAGLSSAQAAGTGVDKQE